MSGDSSRSTRGKLLVTALAVGGAAAVAGLGTYGSFTSTTSASETVSSGTVQIALGASGSPSNRLDVAATGLVPGDTVQRAVDLSVTGDQDLASVGLTTSAATSSLLDSDPLNGLQLTVDACPGGWTEGGTAGAYTYTCGTAPTVLLASQPVIGAGLPLAGLAVTAGSVNHLRVTLSLPAAAGNALQNQSSVIDFAFTGVQRAGTNR